MPHDIETSRGFYQAAFKMQIGQVLELSQAFTPPRGTLYTIAKKLSMTLKCVNIPKANKSVIIRMS